MHQRQISPPWEWLQTERTGACFCQHWAAQPGQHLPATSSPDAADRPHRAGLAQHLCLPACQRYQHFSWLQTKMDSALPCRQDMTDTCAMQQRGALWVMNADETHAGHGTRQRRPLPPI